MATGRASTIAAHLRDTFIVVICTGFNADDNYCLLMPYAISRAEKFLMPIIGLQFF